MKYGGTWKDAINIRKMHSWLTMCKTHSFRSMFVHVLFQEY